MKGVRSQQSQIRFHSNHQPAVNKIPASTMPSLGGSVNGDARYSRATRLVLSGPSQEQHMASARRQRLDQLNVFHLNQGKAQCFHNVKLHKGQWFGPGHLILGRNNINGEFLAVVSDESTTLKSFEEYRKDRVQGLHPD